MISIARYQRVQGSTFQKDIATDQNISVKYLDHIIKSLKVARLIRNAGGKKSGYVLTKDPQFITMYDIFNAFEPGIHVIDCLDEYQYCDRSQRCAAQCFWKELNEHVITHFKNTSLADMMQKQDAIEDQPNSLITLD
jgi:Rrf2 family protein